MSRASLYEFAGGDAAFLRLAAAHHARCLADPVLNHPFSHGTHPEHIARLAGYWAEVFGGPARFSQSCGGHSAMLRLHAQSGADDDLGSRFAACFVQALDDAELPPDRAFRRALLDYMDWAVGDVMAVSPAGATVAAGLPVPRWTWDGAASRAANGTPVGPADVVGDTSRAPVDLDGSR